jgi:hypothetical protein
MRELPTGTVTFLFGYCLGGPASVEAQNGNDAGPRGYWGAVARIEAGSEPLTRGERARDERHLGRVVDAPDLAATREAGRALSPHEAAEYALSSLD